MENKWEKVNPELINDGIYELEINKFTKEIKIHDEVNYHEIFLTKNELNILINLFPRVR